MAYDEDLAERIRELLASERGVTEQQMFGGLSFMLGGNLAVAASREGGILVRVDPGDAARLARTTKAEIALMGARTMRGWVRLAAADVRTHRQLAAWVERGAAYARSLPQRG